MMFEIHSHQGAGPVRFGMTATEVRAALGVEYETFKRSPEDAHPTDYFNALGCFVYCNAGGQSIALEFAEPARPMFNGLDLLNMGFADLLKRIGEIDPEASVEVDGFTSFHLGIGAWAPAADEEPDEPAEAIIAFVPGYYD